MFGQIGEVVILIIMTLIGVALGFLLGRATASRSAAPGEPGDGQSYAQGMNPQGMNPQEAQAARAQIAQLQSQVAQEHAQSAAATSGANEMKQQIAYLQSLIAQLQQQEADRVQAQRERDAAQQQEKLGEQAKQKDAQTQLLQAFAPVQKNLDELGRRVATMEESHKQSEGMLNANLKTLEQRQQELNRATSSLASALSNNKVRGALGEVQLRNIVESAGLVEHVDFETQVVLADASKRPDMVIKLPGGKSIPVDAKTPYSDYSQACAIPDSAPESELERKKQLLANHAKAVRKHVDDLAVRDYHDCLPDAPDFTIAFIPSATVLQAALDADPGLLDYAFSHNVALCSPVTLWAVLKSVAHAWQQQGLTDEAKELYQDVKELYSRLSTMGDTINTLGKSVTSVVKNYNKLVGSLEKRVLPSARKIQKIDMSKVIEPIPQLDPDKTDVRELTAAEFTQNDDSVLNVGVQSASNVDM